MDKHQSCSVSAPKHYSSWSKEELINELSKRDQKGEATHEALISLNILELMHHTQTDFTTVDSDQNIFSSIIDSFLAITNSEYGFMGEFFTGDEGERYYMTLFSSAMTNMP